jgi:hypothetical protein
MVPHLCERTTERRCRGDRAPGVRLQHARVICGHSGWVVGHQHLAERAGVWRKQRADVQRLQCVIGPEHMMDHEHLALKQGAEPHSLAAAGREGIRPVDRT